MTPREAIHRLVDLGYSEQKISDQVVAGGVACTQASVNRIKLGAQRCSWELGEALLRVLERVESEQESAA